MTSNSLTERYMIAMNRIAKWRVVFCGWQLGTRRKGDPECDALGEHREATILQRVELTATAKLLIEKGVFTLEEFQQAMIDESELLEQDYQEKFPGMRATDIGIQYDQRAIKTMKNWRQ